MCGLVIKLHKITFSLFRISHRLVHDSMMIGVIGSSKLIGSVASAVMALVHMLR